MKTPFQPGCTPLILVAAMLVTPFSPTHAADGDPSQPPEKLGSRIVNFFKGLVDRDESPSGYNEYPAQRPSAPPQGQGRSPRRFNLDAPPPIPNGPSYDRGPSEDPANRAPRPRQGTPGANPDEQYDPPTPSNQRPDLPYETPPSESPSRQKPAAESQSRHDDPPSVTKSPTPKPSASPKTAESTPKPANSGHSPVTTTSTASDPDSTPAPEPRRPELPSSKPDESSTASTAPTTPKPPTPSGATAGAPLVGSKTAKPGRVKSPYPPYNELDVTGLSSGSLAMDPTTQKVFRVP